MCFIISMDEARMATDDPKQSGNSGSKSSKKLKPKKIPQRGLGVAQLEKIRFEEQQKKQPNNPSEMEVNSPNLVFKTNPILPNSNSSNKKAQMFSNPLLMSGEPIPGGERYRYDQSGGFVFRPNGNSIPGAAANRIRMKELLQQHIPSPSTVRFSGASSSSVTRYNNQIEPPSNQSFYREMIASSRWPGEEKMIGIKRPYPFPLENRPGLARPGFAFPSNPPVHLQYPIYQSTESYLSANRDIVHAEAQKLLLKEGSASLNMKPQMKIQKVIKPNEELDGNFLTLALPEPSEVAETGTESQEGLNDQATSSGEVAENLDLTLKL